jgi:hypothetical protein
MVRINATRSTASLSVSPLIGCIFPTPATMTFFSSASDFFWTSPEARADLHVHH